MPISDTIDGSELADNEATVYAAVLGHVRTVREITVARAGKRAPILRRFTVQLIEGEDSSALARDAAVRAVEIAETDAGGVRRRYHVAVLGAAPIDRRAPVLATVSIVVIGDGEDDEAPASTTRAAAKLVADVGDRHVRMLDQTISIIERLHPLATATEAASADRVRAAGETEIALTQMKIAQIERQEIVQIACAVLPTFQPLLTAFTLWLTAKAETMGKKKDGKDD